MQLLELEPADNASVFEMDKWGIPVLSRPQERRKAGFVDVACVFFPGVAFDPHNFSRLGQGMGFYDSFEADFDLKREATGKRLVLKVGLALNEMVSQDIPVEAHDVKMEVVVLSSG
jgi:5,10-methenyltetrahydrofolate synthetase